jgi:NADPH-dependent glutamate synthase beta subunit-like oxidoreductase
VDLLPPCNLTCPAGENIQAWLAFAQKGQYEEAWRVIVRDNPLPAIHGRVCYHPCENGCNRKRVDDPVSIHAVERFLGDLAIEKGWTIAPGAPTGKRLLVVGSGPCGLAAAYHLRRLGHEVTVRESAAKLGGMMRYGIPEYRLPRDVLDAEIGRIAQMGVEFQTNARADHLDDFVHKKMFDAVLLAIGAQLSKRVDIPAIDGARILDALKFLASADEKSAICLGRRVAVYGGGNTAMDAARTALRLGAAESIILYRRDQARMPAHRAELDEAVLEGVTVNWLHTVREVGQDEIEVEEMELDPKGSPRPTGRVRKIQADMLICALGQETQSQFLQRVPGVTITGGGIVEVDDRLMTGHPGIFAGGDMVPDNKTVTIAVGHGKKAARHIDAYLKGETFTKPPKHGSAKFNRLKPDYYAKAPAAVQPVLDAQRRLNSFTEVLGGLDEPTAFAEAKRCLSCGNCMECDSCMNACPNLAIVRRSDGDRYEIILDDCIGCAVCSHECPCGAIDMLKERV